MRVSRLVPRLPIWLVSSVVPMTRVSITLLEGKKIFFSFIGFFVVISLHMLPLPIGGRLILPLNKNDQLYINSIKLMTIGTWESHCIGKTLPFAFPAK